MIPDFVKLGAVGKFTPDIDRFVEYIEKKECVEDSATWLGECEVLGVSFRVGILPGEYRIVLLSDTLCYVASIHEFIIAQAMLE